jgi:hypothetical protein
MSAGGTISISSQLQFYRMHFKHITMTIGQLEDIYNSGKYDLNPDWQREEVWTPSMGVNFIKSIWNGNPIPEMCIWERPDGIKHPVDCKQRSTNIFSYTKDSMTVDRLKFKKRTDVDKAKFRATTFNVLYLTKENSEAEVIAYFKVRNTTSVSLGTGELFKADIKQPILLTSNALFKKRDAKMKEAFGEKKTKRSGDLKNQVPLLASYVKDDLKILTQAYKGPIADVLATVSQEDVDAKLPSFELALDQHISVCANLCREQPSLAEKWRGQPPLRKVSSIWVSIIDPKKIGGKDPQTFWSDFYKALERNALNAAEWEKKTRANATPSALDAEIEFARIVVTKSTV